MATPDFCQYCAGPCDQDLSVGPPCDAFFMYPSQPAHLAHTVQQAVAQLRTRSPARRWQSWEDLRVAGKIVFCAICKAIRNATLTVADVTTLNFNVLFELGYAIGLGKPVLPVRDTTYQRDAELFTEIGVFDVLGFAEFCNSGDLVSIVSGPPPQPAFAAREAGISTQQPIYCLVSPVDTDGNIKLLSSLKKSYFRFRTFDSRETPRLSLHEAHRQVHSSLAVIAHLIDAERIGAVAHNARAAFVCGMALAAGKIVLALQEGIVQQPIDYRDVVVGYTAATQVPDLVEKLVREVADQLQSFSEGAVTAPAGLLERVDLGDLAAENEIQALHRYFVKTPQYQEARQGHARVVVGRKGSGKTAIFYAVRDSVKHTGNPLVLDLKPEGHQFTRLRETVMVHLGEGMQLHTLTAFWTYLLLLELARKILESERQSAYSSPESLETYSHFKKLYEAEAGEQEGDFSERLMALVNRLMERFPGPGEGELRSPQVTSLIYEGDIHALEDAVMERLEGRSAVWVLFDNIDKGWPTLGATREDIAIVRCLLEATRKLQRSLERRGVELYILVFLRKDIYDLLLDQTPDRGKESVANLDWSDPQLLKELVLRRAGYKTELRGRFEDVWPRLLDPHVGGQDSFRYILERTFDRPRDVLNFVRKSIQIAVSRGHDRAGPEDVRAAESAYAEDMLNAVVYELRDVFPAYGYVPHQFLGQHRELAREDVHLLLREGGVKEEDLGKVVDLLLWFGFLGLTQGDEERYAYQYLYNLAKLKAFVDSYEAKSTTYCIHPAFRKALEVQ
jgi:hypothetical protein